VVHAPAGPAGEGTAAYASGYAVSAKSAAPQAAWQAVACLTSEEAQKAMLESGAALPSRRSFEGYPYLVDNPAANTFYSGARYASPYAWGPHHAEVAAVVGEALRRIYYDGWGVDESFYKAAEEIRAIIAE